MLAMTLRRKRLVRLHLKEERFSLEGVLVGVDQLHYRIANASQVGRSEQGQDVTIALDSTEVWVPRATVIYLQVIG